mgnify:CR=1 FL=1
MQQLDYFGTLKVGHNVKIGYFAQNQASLLDGEQTVFDTIDRVAVGDIRLKIRDILGAFMFGGEASDKKVKVLSGGEKSRLAMIRLLLEPVNLLILDEPTNDIDLETLTWMEEFLKTEQRPILFVSHDETLLSRTANCILHIEQIKKKTEPRNTFVHLDYDSYVIQRLHKIEHQSQMAVSERREYKKSQEKLNRIMQKVDHAQATISRGDPHGARLLKKKMKNLKAQERKLAGVELTEKPDVEEGIHLFFEDVRIPNGKVVLEMKKREISVNEMCLLSDVNLKITGNAHVCFVGKNGSGKTTLMKEIYKELKDREDLSVGYMPQNYSDLLKENETVLEFLCERGDRESVTRARLCLGNLKFTRDEMTGLISDLSNGSKAKLFLLKLILDRNDVLLLDEPTRNVSPLSNPVIRKALSDYNGCIISVSHDRKYLNEVINEFYRIENGKCVKCNKESIFID